MSDEKVYLPKLGMQMQEATVVTWVKRPGEAVAVGDMLCRIETDKVETELVSEVAGRLKSIEVAEGDTVPVGAILAVIDTMN
jgi:pyruvate/2-oxoglutarate dehydrogenase complex dihydrolipoamide acyltransferase (E2) component